MPFSYDMIKCRETPVHIEYVDFSLPCSCHRLFMNDTLTDCLEKIRNNKIQLEYFKRKTTLFELHTIE